MNTASLTRIVGWSAWISAAGTVLTFLTGILFFTIGQPFGTIEDASSVIQVVFMIPLAIGLYWLIPSTNKAVDFLGLAVGILGMLFTCVGQSLLVIGRIDYPTSMKFFPAGLAIGIWLLAACALARASGFFPTGLAWAGFVAGAGYILTVAGFLLGGQQSVVFYTGGLALTIGYLVWAIWLARLLLYRNLDNR